MPEDILVQCCAPTLAGIKTGSMFSCPFEDAKTLAADLRLLNRSLASYGLRILSLRYSEGRALLYLFRPDRLREDLKNRSAQEILNEAGYGGLAADQCLVRLIRRLRERGDFPHEIGLFLSYPPEDVRGFIENHAQNYKFIGYWKVYGDEAAARRTFEKYKKCTDSYCKRLSAGCALSQLAVAV